MVSEFDASEFVDDDLQAIKDSARTAPGTSPKTAPSKEEVEAKVGQMQSKLSELKRAQQDLEKERASLEETRRRQVEFSTGRQEMIEHLTRGIGLLEEAEFDVRRQSEQMSNAVAELKDALQKIQSIHEESWTKENLHVELTRASTTIENARMEWNSARLKFDILNGTDAGVSLDSSTAGVGNNGFNNLVRARNYGELCKVGLALTWPVALVGLALLLVLLLKQS